MVGHDQSRVQQSLVIRTYGNCHNGKLGPVADAQGRVEVEIRGLDQTVIGNSAHDLIRLASSLSMGGRSSDLLGVTTAMMTDTEKRSNRQADAERGGNAPKIGEIWRLKESRMCALPSRWQKFLGIDYWKALIRELRPQGLKFEFAPITQAEASRRPVSCMCGRQSPCRQMDDATRRKRLAELNKTQCEAFVASCLGVGMCRGTGRCSRINLCSTLPPAIRCRLSPETIST